MSAAMSKSGSSDTLFKRAFLGLAAFGLALSLSGCVIVIDGDDDDWDDAHNLHISPLGSEESSDKGSPEATADEKPALGLGATEQAGE